MTDDDVMMDEKKIPKVNTKNIRGVGKKKLARDKEMEVAAAMYAGN